MSCEKVCRMHQVMHSCASLYSPHLPSQHSNILQQYSYTDYNHLQCGIGFGGAGSCKQCLCKVKIESGYVCDEHIVQPDIMVPYITSALDGPSILEPIFLAAWTHTTYIGTLIGTLVSSVCPGQGLNSEFNSLCQSYGLAVAHKKITSSFAKASCSLQACAVPSIHLCDPRCLPRIFGFGL